MTIKAIGIGVVITIMSFSAGFLSHNYLVNQAMGVSDAKMNDFDAKAMPIVLKSDAVALAKFEESLGISRHRDECGVTLLINGEKLYSGGRVNFEVFSRHVEESGGDDAYLMLYEIIRDFTHVESTCRNFV